MKAIFLDRDGILNEERGDYTWKLKDFVIVAGIIDMLKIFKKAGFYLIVITNQAGIAKGIYQREDMKRCHEYFQEESGALIDHFYYATGHPNFSESLSRKPDSLLFEKAIAKYDLDPFLCWMVGDKERDLIPAKKLGIKTILYSNNNSKYADFRITNIRDLAKIII